ncbi:hypothetical protein IG631_16166 [Alternaria alternata]|nr:hypothetical protein IG631_16166 [Alternaria alternata]
MRATMSPRNNLGIVEIFAEDASSKLFAIECTKCLVVFRVSLPVAPAVRINSEVAT